MLLPIYFTIKNNLYLDIIEKIQNGIIEEKVPFLVEYYWLELQENNTVIQIRKTPELSTIVIDVLIALVNEELKRNSLKEKEEVNIYFTSSQLDKLIKQYLDFL